MVATCAPRACPIAAPARSSVSVQRSSLLAVRRPCAEPPRHARRLQSLPLSTHPHMATLQELADRIERLVLRHEELKRTNALLEEKVAQLGGERDSLKSRLAAARSRIDALLERLPAGPADDNHR